jgi:hypothetical protein
MTTLTLRMVKGNFVVTGPDIEPMRFETRREVKDWWLAHHPGSPITKYSVGPRRSARKTRTPSLR